MNMDEIGNKIAKYRKSHQLTQLQLSKKLGMSRSTLSEIENGKIVEIGIRKVMALCELLGLQLSVMEKNNRPTLTDLTKDNQHD